ncbi:MAG: YdcF family protein, partial [Oceanibaculum sp.]
VQRGGLGRFALHVALTLLFVWFLGVMAFIAAIPLALRDATTRTDAIVVLTGGSLRLEVGLRLLQAGLAERLLVSGVNPEVSREALLRLLPEWTEALNARIDIDYAANNTVGNAAETAIWLREREYRSLRLVTANYHLRRSLLEFRDAMPGIDIVPHPVFPEDFHLEDWWRWPGSAALIFSEYNKFLMVHLRLSLAGLIKG